MQRVIVQSDGTGPGVTHRQAFTICITHQGATHQCQRTRSNPTRTFKKVGHRLFESQVVPGPLVSVGAIGSRLHEVKDFFLIAFAFGEFTIIVTKRLVLGAHHLSLCRRCLPEKGFGGLPHRIDYRVEAMITQQEKSVITTGGIEWHQKEPNTMLVKWLEEPMQVYRTANGYLGANAAAATRTPPAHPEGYLEGFANIYKNFANHIRAVNDGTELPAGDPALDYPTIKDGVRGMAFIEAVVGSSQNNAAWTKLDV